ncbi:hypothetical protein MNB_SM-3-734 [hydrothermal vent metagenome]|uniref:Uracil-DNA glycosylase-like domain-containing protein n=1 Tax=hydrothermal vent metagenome TaxID=652676 RepID=A0A1W1D3P2_9ZZZZ
MTKQLFPNLSRYFVPDIVYEDTKIIFVLESPHIQEVKMGYPVAGKSGYDMSNVLFGINEAFGKLVFEQKIKNIGIINVCNYPLQHSAYNEMYDEVVFFEKIRQNPNKRRYDKEGINDTLLKIMDDFYKRLVIHKDKKIVLCGRFAQNAFYNLFDTNEFQAVLFVPHPSFNNWKKEKYQEQIQLLKRFII